MSTEIFVVLYNQPDIELRCLESIKKHTDLKQHKLTVVDNWRRDKNLSALWNELIEGSKKENICLLNSDTEVTADWLEGLEETLGQQGPCAVGPRTNNCGSGQQLSNKPGTVPGRPSGFCLLFPRSVWKKQKGFREDFPFYGQDSNFIFRHNLKTFINRDVFVHHLGGVSAKASGRDSWERKLGASVFHQNRQIQWRNERLLVLGAGDGNPFPMFRGIDLALREFRREGMEAWHLNLDAVTERQVEGLAPTVLLVANTNVHRIQRVASFAKRSEAKVGLWFVDLRGSFEKVSGFDCLFLAFQGRWQDAVIADWEANWGVPVDYMPQAGPIHTELVKSDIMRRLVFVGDIHNSTYHKDRAKLVKQLGAIVYNSAKRNLRIRIEQSTPTLYRNSKYCLVVSPDAKRYNSNRLYNVLCYGGFALVKYFEGLEDLFENHVQLCWFETAEQAREIMDYYDAHLDEYEQIRQRGWRTAQAKHTVGFRLMNMIHNLESGSREFWGYLQ